MDNQAPDSSATIKGQSGIPAFGIEWKALAAGLVAALLWHFSQKVFFDTLISQIGTNRYIELVGNNYLGVLIQISFSLAHGTFVGFVVGWVGRHHPYRCAVIVAVVEIMVATWMQWREFPPGFTFPSVYYIWWAISFTLSLIGVANGVWLAQSARRRRAVRIQ